MTPFKKVQGGSFEEGTQLTFLTEKSLLTMQFRPISNKDIIIKWLNFNLMTDLFIFIFNVGDLHWFTEGKLNACYNCVDKHLPAKADQTAIIWDGDEIGTDLSFITTIFYINVFSYSFLLFWKLIHEYDKWHF